MRAAMSAFSCHLLLACRCGHSHLTEEADTLTLKVKFVRAIWVGRSHVEQCCGVVIKMMERGVWFLVRVHFSLIFTPTCRSRSKAASYCVANRTQQQKTNRRTFITWRRICRKLATWRGEVANAIGTPTHGFQPSFAVRGRGAGLGTGIGVD